METTITDQWRLLEAKIQKSLVDGKIDTCLWNRLGNKQNNIWIN